MIAYLTHNLNLKRYELNFETFILKLFPSINTICLQKCYELHLFIFFALKTVYI